MYVCVSIRPSIFRRAAYIFCKLHCVCKTRLDRIVFGLINCYHTGDKNASFALQLGNPQKNYFESNLNEFRLSQSELTYFVNATPATEFFSSIVRTPLSKFRETKKSSLAFVGNEPSFSPNVTAGKCSIKRQIFDAILYLPFSKTKKSPAVFFFSICR